MKLPGALSWVEFSGGGQLGKILAVFYGQSACTVMRLHLGEGSLGRWSQAHLVSSWYRGTCKVEGGPVWSTRVSFLFMIKKNDTEK